MGIVWQAEDERLGTNIALKFLPPAIRHDPAALHLLRTEIRRCQELSHRNIIRIHDLHEPTGEELFFSMEYVEGLTLSALRVQQPAQVLSWDFLAPLMVQLCEALAYAHTENIIHRDLKPANLMVDRRNRLKLADFGIAGVVSDTISRLTAPRGIAGTLAYMSPQQLEGGPPRVTDDLYSVGATLFELLTGTPPFHTGDISHQVRNCPAPTMGERLAQLSSEHHIPGHVEETVTACLAKNAADRPQSVLEISRRLGLASSAPSAPAAAADRSHPSRPSFVDRHRLMTGVLLGLAAVGFWWKYATIAPPQKPVRGQPWENSLGMKFAPVGEVLFSIWETRVQDYAGVCPEL